jgi:hypothetical protein
VRFTEINRFGVYVAPTEAESPAAIERRMARDAVRVARDATLLHGSWISQWTQ